MNRLSFVLAIVLFCSCEKQKDENDKNDLGLQNIQGSWNWKSTCGGFSGGCIYPSTNHHSKMYLDTITSTYIDTVFYYDTFNVIVAEYSLIKLDKNHGTLYVTDHFQYNISVYADTLTVNHGDLHDYYIKIK